MDSSWIISTVSCVRTMTTPNVEHLRSRLQEHLSAPLLSPRDPDGSDRQDGKSPNVNCSACPADRLTHGGSSGSSFPSATGAEGNGVPWQAMDPILSLKTEASRSLIPRSRRGGTTAVRERYFHYLAQQRLAVAGFVPNLAPILRWNNPSCTPSPASSNFASPADPSDDRKRNRVAHNEQDHECPTNTPCIGDEITRKLAFPPGSIRSSVVNVSAAALGAGALALPRAMYYSGIICGPLLMIGLAFLSVLSIKIIVQLVEVSGKNSYEEIAKVAFGPWFALLVEFNMILFCFGTAVAYMITVSQISHGIIEAGMLETGMRHGDAVTGFAAYIIPYITPTAVLVVVTCVILLPLSLCDSINDLRFASLAGVTCIAFLIVVVIYASFKGVGEASLHHDEVWNPRNGIWGCFKMLSLAIFAFCCQPNIPSIYSGLERKSFRRMDKVSLGAIGLCLVVYLLMGIVGYWTFGETTAGNVLVNLQPKLCELDVVVVLGFMCMAFAVTTAFPLNIFPIRFAVESALFYKWPHLNKRKYQTLLAVCAVLAALAVAIVMPHINLIFEIIGATTGSFVCFIGPGLLIQKLVPGGWFSGPRLNGLFLVIVGVVFLVFGTYSSVMDVISQLSETTPQATCARRT